MRILEAGFWSEMAARVRCLELHRAERQGADFHLRAPDEPEARAVFEAAHPEEVERRGQLLACLTPPELDPLIEGETVCEEPRE